jgi:FlaA1/EpsC-like NDP-sugar epimerase
MSRAWRYLFIKIIADVVAVNVSFICAFLAKFKTINFISAVAIYYKPLFFITVLWLVVMNLAGLYKLQQDKVNRIDNLFSVSFGAFSAAFFTYVIVIYLYQEASYSKDIVITGSLAALVLLNISRDLIWKAYKR